NASLYRQAQQAALTDDLTGLGNTRHFNRVLPALLARGGPASLAVLDLDGLKAVVARYGHLVGSRAIAEGGHVTGGRLRPGDGAARRRLLHAIEHRLTSHSRIEEDLFYPAVKELAMESAEEMVDKALQDEGLVEHHTEEEEREMFRLAEKLDEAQLEELGDRMAARAGEAER